MSVFWVFHARSVKKYAIITVAALFSAAVLFAERDALVVFTTGAIEDSGPAAITRVDTDEKKLALTFDISWGDKQADFILDALDENGVEKATFFLAAPWAEHHPETVHRIQEMEYEIGSHGYEHTPYSQLEDDDIREQIVRAERTLASLTGEKPRLLRPPNGDVDQRVLRVADHLGYHVIQWHTDSHDWLRPGVSQIVENVTSNVVPGDIILMHASDSSTQTAEALPEIVRHLQQEGYELVTVSELISGIETDLQEVP